jgi:hypothetical protein
MGMSKVHWFITVGMIFVIGGLLFVSFKSYYNCKVYNIGCYRPTNAAPRTSSNEF